VGGGVGLAVAGAVGEDVGRATVAHDEACPGAEAIAAGETTCVAAGETAGVADGEMAASAPAAAPLREGGSLPPPTAARPSTAASNSPPAARPATGMARTADGGACQTSGSAARVAGLAPGSGRPHCSQ